MMWVAFHRIDDLLIRLSWIPTAMLLIATVILAFQAADRRVPFELLSVEPAFAYAGDTVTINGKVWRDTSRECSVRMSRWSFDSQNARSDYPLSEFPADMIRKMEDETPGEMKITLPVSPKSATGKSRVFSHLKYRCNLGHWLVPIEVTTVMTYIVLP